MNLISPLFHIFCSALFVQIRYQMEEQASRVAVMHDKIHEDGQVCIVLPEFGQGFEHPVVVNLPLYRCKSKYEEN